MFNRYMELLSYIITIYILSFTPHIAASWAITIENQDQHDTIDPETTASRST